MRSTCTPWKSALRRLREEVHGVSSSTNRDLQSYQPNVTKSGAQCSLFELGSAIQDRANLDRPANCVLNAGAQKSKRSLSGSILAQFQNCPIYRESRIAIGSDEEFCARYDAIAKEDHSCVATAEERKRHENRWVLVLNSPMEKRSDEPT